MQDFERGEDPHSARPTRPSEEQVRRMAKVYGVEPAPLLRLAGYSSIGQLAPWEEELILYMRSLPEEGRRRLVSQLASLLEASTGEADR